MIRILTCLIKGIVILNCHEDKFSQEFEAGDIINFWDAYDNIVETNDTLRNRISGKELVSMQKQIEGELIRKELLNLKREGELPITKHKIFMRDMCPYTIDQFTSIG